MRRLSIQIQPRISEEMKQRIDQECKTRRVTQGEIVDAALEAFFYPQQEEETKYELILRQYAALRELIVERTLALEARLDGPSPDMRSDESPVQEKSPQTSDTTIPRDFYDQVVAIRDHHAAQTHPLVDVPEAEALMPYAADKPRRGLLRFLLKDAHGTPS